MNVVQGLIRRSDWTELSPVANGKYGAVCRCGWEVQRAGRWRVILDEVIEHERFHEASARLAPARPQGVVAAAWKVHGSSSSGA